MPAQPSEEQTPKGKNTGGGSSSGGGGSHHQRTSNDSVGSAHSRHSTPASPPRSVAHFSVPTSGGAGSAPGGASAASASKGISRPPGLAPLSAGHSKQSSTSTAQSLTLTPASSVDGAADLYQNMSISSTRNAGVQHYNEGPSLPALRQSEFHRRAGGGSDDDGHAELPRGITTFGSFDSSLDGGEDDNDNSNSNNNNDGLLGLSALRERAHSSPGPINVNTVSFSSSPPTRSQQLGPGATGLDDSGNTRSSLAYDNRRSRTVSRDAGRGAHSSRPPLAGGIGASSPHTESTFTGDRSNSAGSGAASFSTGRSMDPSPPPSFQPDSSTDFRAHGPGIISRPDVRFSQTPPDSGERERPVSESSLRRSISTDTGREFIQNMFASNPPQSIGDHNRSASHSSSPIDHPFSSNLHHYQQQHPSPHSQMIPAVPPHHQQQRSHIPQSNYSPAPYPSHGAQRHQRSFSQPGPLRSSSQSDYSQPPDETNQRRISEYPPNRIPPGMEGDYSLPSSDAGIRYGNMPPQQLPPGRHHRAPSGDGSVSSGNNFVFASHNRSMSLQAGQSPSDVVQHQRRGSLQYQGGNQQQYGSSSSLNRRDGLEFTPYHGRSDSAGPVLASNEEMRIYGGEMDRMGGGYMRQQDRMVSPAHSPMHSNYSGGHSRHPSDMGSSVGMSSSPMSLGSGGMRGGVLGQGHDPYGGLNPPRISHRRMIPQEDDMSHSLLGEHIEVPSEDQSFMNSMTRGLSRSGSGHHHIGGMEPLPAQGFYSSHDTSRHLPTAGSNHPQPKVVYNVKFKRTQRSFVLGPRINRDMKIGTYVKVEADRGEDLGIVVGKIPSEKYNAPSRSAFRSSGPGEMSIIPPPTGLSSTSIGDLKRIIRLATHDEVSLLTVKREEEEELLKICRTKVRQRGLPMNVVDAEYQFDRHKLTFFFEAEGRVDFRELVRDLFSIYKTRIWMQQLDKSQNTVGPTAIPPPPPVMIDYGTPIIAPASEFAEFATYNNAAADNNAD